MRFDLALSPALRPWLRPRTLGASRVPFSAQFRATMRSVASCAAWCVALNLMLFQSHAAAQTPTQTPLQPPAPNLAPSSWPRTTPDVMYPRYTPAQCVESVARMNTHYWRDKRRDTVQFAPATESVPTPIRDSASVCATHFIVSTVPEDQLIPLAELELAIGDDAQADAAVERLMTLAAKRSPEQRAWLLDLAVDMALGARPARLPRALAYLARLDALGPAAAYARLSAHRLYASYAWAMGDAAIAASESGKAILAFKELSHAQQVDMIDTAASSYRIHADAIHIVAGSVAATTVLDSARTLLIPLAQTGNQWGALEQNSLMRLFAMLRETYAPVGTVAKPVKADFWFHASDDTPGDTVFPKPGAVTLAVLVDRLNEFDTFATLRRLHERYAAQGVRIVCMLSTQGFFRSQIEAKPADEAAKLDDWYLTYLKLPVTLAVEISQFGRLPDGRRKNTPAVNRRNYDHGVHALLIGKDGKIVLATDVGSGTEAIIARQIEAALTK